ncbi:mannose-1-phosphate guanylyltransferase/mannose-6-phosphate isomerase [Aliivibrio sp. S2TY2]|uniref:mannose-1-phosphate guanylyltransferase/mannose-6-phosphate isomerase n=1 Tax=unclassified Aliivibrio TaxID=2645654 RepID=UPI0023783D0E|nr:MULTISPECIES: mannose-1-phosphate guanylyltransferase/mannose-6-phosphate isomerase [unclassified Aliivibrio]MDD9174890.1 mannose-1-phosphate guanylyltransferase/mannose-6-phosphate isomerase [Aliivibrio sp. S3TY1]MDD9192163.1 mannose-1-phosphate guanylyltransferase/mannose-6-phosphate isomerase [Aliivibrio sp. S2TY2]
MLIPIIMAGGTGSRLWPLSRELYPKQFLKVVGDESMLQQTFARLHGLDYQSPLVICNEEHRFIAAEQTRLGGFEHSGIILEPVGRNTAPAIALAALQALKQVANSEVEPILLVLAADHLIENQVAFQLSVNQALVHAESGQLVTFGIVPTSAETGYGYIKRGSSQNDTAFKVDSFVEKPDLATAQRYFDSGEYYWNSGMFMFKASQYLNELKKHNPEMLKACERSMSKIQVDLDFIRVDKKNFEACPSDSIDYAVLEPVCSVNGSGNLVVVPIDAGWSDIGSWSALWDVSAKDCNKNAHKGDVISVKSTNNYVYSENKLIATVGVDNLVIVETKDAILVADKSQVQDVKAIVQKLKDTERSEYKIHRQVYRPWGKYDSIDFGDRDQVKRITVNPGQKLSIQKHYHRSEHWIVVAGTASVTNGDEVILVTEDQSTYIPLGTIHALENPGKIPLEMIEVQTGSYLGEDDIVRFEDRYGRI